MPENLRFGCSEDLFVSTSRRTPQSSTQTGQSDPSSCPKMVQTEPFQQKPPDLEANLAKRMPETFPEEKTVQVEAQNVTRIVPQLSAIDFQDSQKVRSSDEKVGELVEVENVPSKTKRSCCG